MNRVLNLTNVVIRTEDEREYTPSAYAEDVALLSCSENENDPDFRLPARKLEFADDLKTMEIARIILKNRKEGLRCFIVGAEVMENLMTAHKRSICKNKTLILEAALQFVCISELSTAWISEKGQALVVKSFVRPYQACLWH